MSNYIEQPAASQDKAVDLKNTLGQVATAPFYIWANDDCANKTNNFKEAKAIRLKLLNEGGESVHIVDADGVEVVDAEIEAHEALVNAGYFAGARKPEVKPEFHGAFMVNDPQDPEGFAIVGDDIASLILEARDRLIEPASEREMTKTQEIESLRMQGYTVAPSKSKAGTFRWWRETGSDGVSVPRRELSDTTYNTAAEAWDAAKADSEIVFGVQTMEQAVVPREMPNYIEQDGLAEKALAEALVARIEADIAQLRKVCVDPMSIKLAEFIDIEVRPGEDDDRVLVGRTGWGHTVVNYTKEGLIIDVFGHEELVPIHTANIYADDLEPSEVGRESQRPSM